MRRIAQQMEKFEEHVVVTAASRKFTEIEGQAKISGGDRR